MALLEIEIEIEVELWNTSPFLALYSRSRSQQSTDEARSAPVPPRKRIAWEGDNNSHRHTLRLLDQLGPEGRVGEKYIYLFSDV